MTSLQSENYYRALFLKKRYRSSSTQSWENLQKTADRTTDVLRDVVECLVDYSDSIGDQELTTLFRLCQNNNDGLSVEEKRQIVRELDLPEEETERIAGKIQDTIGSVGSAKQKLTLYVGGKDGEYPEEEKKLHECFQKIIQNYSEPERIKAAQKLTEIEFHEVQSGRMSPILHYLAPETFPVINGRSRGGMELLFNYSISSKLTDYLEEREEYLRVRKELDFKSHFRDLDYFLQWSFSEDSIWTKGLREGIDREVWQAQPGSNDNSYPEVLWPIWREKGLISVGWDIGSSDKISSDSLDPQEDNFALKMSPGDIVVANGGNYDMLGIGVVSPDGYEYVDGTSREIEFSNEGEPETHPSIRHVDWIYTRDSDDEIDIRDWEMSKQFHNKTIVGYTCYEELRYDLSQNYPEESLTQIEGIEKTSLDYITEDTKQTDLEYATSSYFILQTGSEDWEDERDEQYHFTVGIPGSRKLLEAGSAQVAYLEDEKLYATARVVDINQKNRGEETHCFAEIEEYEEIQPVEITSLLGGFETSVSLQHPIIQINKNDYRTIVGSGEKTVFDDFQEELAVPKEDITVEKQNLYFPDEEWNRIQNRVEQALEDGNNVLLFGPPGTGKTKLARQVCEKTVGRENYELVTASADWSTFDTVGGYQTTSENTLEFEPGIVLDRFQRDSDESPTNEWLIIDELNRADIDKAFGSLFSALTGESVTLPFDGTDGNPIEIIDASRSHEEVSQSKFYIPEDWRMLATMNTLDKTSLYEMSYAFMRRWAFIPVGIPELPERKEEDDTELEELVRDYVEEWSEDGEVPEAEQHYEPIGRIWRAINEKRAIGPAIVEDIYEYVATSSREDGDYVSPIIMYVFPQLEGLRRNELEALIERLDSIVEDDTGELWTVARDFFQVELQPSEGE